MFGRLFEGLQESIKRRCREHVHFVDYIDFESTLRGGELTLLAQATNLLDTVIRSTVDFDHVHARAIHNGLTGLRLIVGRRTGTAFSIESLSEKTSGTGLTRSAWPHKEVGVSDSLAINGVTQGAHDMILPHQFIELLGTPATSDYLICLIHRSVTKQVR